jgi:tRNA(Ile)-lysidine synthase TilS/MesJ
LTATPSAAPPAAVRHEGRRCVSDRSVPIVPIALCFSGGKDSVLALAAIQRQARYEVVRLVTTP